MPSEIITIFKYYTEIRAEELFEDVLKHLGLIEKIEEDTEKKLNTRKILEDGVNEIQSRYQQCCDEIEILDIKLIRIKTELKKVIKNVSNLKTLESLWKDLQATANDKARLGHLMYSLCLTKYLLGTWFSSDECDGHHGVVSDSTYDLLTFAQNLSSKEENHDVVWKSIEKSSHAKEQWDFLFQ